MCNPQIEETLFARNWTAVDSIYDLVSSQMSLILRQSSTTRSNTSPHCYRQICIFNQIWDIFHMKKLLRFAIPFHLRCHWFCSRVAAEAQADAFNVILHMGLKKKTWAVRPMRVLFSGDARLLPSWQLFVFAGTGDMCVCDVGQECAITCTSHAALKIVSILFLQNNI